MWKSAVIVIGLGCAVGCASPTEPTAIGDGARGEAVALATGGAAGPGATGGGMFQITLASGELVDVQFGMSAVTTGNGSAEGHFTHRTVLGGFAVEFKGTVTCLAVDADNRRAWVGGVITQNASDHPSFTTPRTQPGRDIWFRVLDKGQGQADPDRSTFVGFEGDGGIATSAAYCQTRPWPAGDARTWPLTAGNLQVRP